MEQCQCTACHSLRIMILVMQYFCLYSFFWSLSKDHWPDNVHITLQIRVRVWLLQYSKPNPFFFCHFLVYVSLKDHKIRDFIARQLVSAQRWGGFSVFTARDLLLVGVSASPKENT